MFKQCTLCGHQWENREAFLADPDLEIIGYQVSFETIENGLFLFNHICETTLAIEVKKFDDLYKGPKYDMALTDTEECLSLCRDINALDTCSAPCKFAYVRDIIQIIRRWPPNKPKLLLVPENGESC
ncbi:MAG: hypothetical protein JRF02_06295 [Deltaproteobacteria bacterium]|nr:hypothetical protein [Deltaproteobacteria bacterium]